MKRITELKAPAYFIASAAVGGREEWQGPLGGSFDFIDPSDSFGQSTWEMAEAEMGRVALNVALRKCDLSHSDIDVIIAGDLQNQCVASAIALDSFGIPHIGVYGACSTCTESLMLASAMLSLGSYKRVATLTTSHNLAAERQFRAPTEYGAQRPPAAQWTATAGGAFILSTDDEIINENRRRGLPVSACITDFLVGRLIDGAIKDGANMGAAMAFAAADSILSYFEESDLTPRDFDLIVTGDLGAVGSRILREILKEKLPSAVSRHEDCGLLLYDMSSKDVHAGASGCGTSASVLSTHFLPMLERGEVGDILFLSTGALMSQSSLLQGNSIRGVAPAVHLKSLTANNKRSSDKISAPCCNNDEVRISDTEAYEKQPSGSNAEGKPGYTRPDSGQISENNGESEVRG
ncbi:MAG: stage V sporulation protein AD [Clostridia bacterium]|nr:stage V sporulation protein AD [Clostridia bacterium]